MIGLRNRGRAWNTGLDFLRPALLILLLTVQLGHGLDRATRFGSVPHPSGMEKSWSQNGVPRALQWSSPACFEFSSGTHLIRAVASKPERIWTRASAALAADVPPFYQTGWLYVLAGVGVLVMAAGFYGLRIRALQRRESKLVRLVDEKTQALQLEIEERIRAEQEAKESQALYHSLVEHLPINIYRKDVNGRFTFANTLFCKTLGKALEEIIGKTDYDFSARELAEKYRRDDNAVIERGKVFQDIEQHLNLHGEPTYIQIMKAPVRGFDGAIRGTQGMFFDITERVRTEQDLVYERDLLRTLLDHSPDHIYFKDLESRFIRCSSTLGRRFGLRTPDEAIGKTDFDFFDPDHARETREDEQRIIGTGQPIIGKVEREVWINTGETTWVLTSKHLFRDRDGRIIGTFGISKDITAIKNAELEVERLHRQLWETSRQAGMAEVATSVLHNVGNVLNSVNVSTTLLSEKLRKSKISSVGKVAQMLEAHGDDLPAFFASDKARQLPTYVTSLAEHLACEQKQMLQELASLAQNIDHIKEIVAMQQSYSKVAGVRETLSVIDMVEDAIRMNAAALGRHTIEIERDYSPVPEICVEKHKVLQILVNLIRNAKYALDDSGRPDKKLILRVGVGGEDFANISVIDNGIGIPPENLTRIFAHGFTTKKDGHGFGLHSGALAAQEMGGFLKVHSDGPGHGACFTLALPLIQKDNSKTLTPEPVPSESHHSW
jgi:PAS domain S-box-containing protein